MTPRLPARGLAGRLDAIEKTRDARRLMHPYRLADGSTARLSTLDVLDALRDALALNYAERHDHDPAAPVDAPPAITRTLARVDTDSDQSMFGRLVQQASAAWCDAYDHQDGADA